MESSRLANDPDLSAQISILRCLKCGNTVECKLADLLRFTQTRWLRCCDEVMTLFQPVDVPVKSPDPPGDQRT
jgi:hypothetical protein